MRLSKSFIICHAKAFGPTTLAEKSAVSTKHNVIYLAKIFPVQLRPGRTLEKSFGHNVTLNNAQAPIQVDPEVMQQMITQTH